MTSRQKQRTLVVISGYYGFGNLGDEAILEQLTLELKELVSPESIVVLSNSPAKTEELTELKACSRWNPFSLGCLLANARLFVSGGGGLFQETNSLGSVLYYAGQIFMSRALGCPSLVYAQGIGPFKTSLGKYLTGRAMSLCKAITVRDSASADFLEGWRIEHTITADPVWGLNSTPLPEKLAVKLKQFVPNDKYSTVGLSLRHSPNFNESHLRQLIDAMASALPVDCKLILMSLQDSQDTEILQTFAANWDKNGRQSIIVKQAELKKPSQWLALMENLDFMISMRMHAALMSLKQGITTVGIAYDPKVANLLAEFDQPTLNLTNNNSGQTWAKTLGQAYANREELSANTLKKTEVQKNLACQNINVLARILNMQSSKKHSG